MVSAQQHNVVTAISGKVDAYLSDAARDLEMLGTLIQSRDYKADPLLTRTLDIHATQRSLYEAVYLLDANGMVAAAGLPQARHEQRANLVGMDLSANNFVRVAREYNRPVWSDTFLSITSGQLSVALAIPLKNYTLVGEVGIETLSELLSEIRRESGLEVMAVDSKGHIVAHPDVDQAIQKLNLGHLEPVQTAAEEGSAVTADITLNGNERLAIATPLHSINWVLMASQPLELINQPLRLAAWIMLAGIGISMLFALTIGAQVARRLAWRIRTYSQHARDIAAGRREHRWPVSKVTEFRELAANLQRMSDQLYRHEQQVQASERSYRELIEDVEDLVVRVDPEGRFTFVNHASRHIFGLEPGQCLGLSAFDFIHPGDRESTEQAFNNWLHFGKTHFSFENRIMRRDGEVCHVSWSIRVHQNGDEEVVDMVAIGRDITHQVKAQEALKEREKRYRALVQQSPLAIIEWNLDFEVAEWNRAAERIFGYGREEMLGQSAEVLAAPEQRTEQKTAWQQLLASTGGTRQEWVNLNQDGVSLTCVWYSRPLIDEDLQVSGAISLVEDITEHKAVEQKLAASEAQFSTLFHASPVPMTVVRGARGESLLDCNSAWEKMFGADARLALGPAENTAGIWIGSADREAVWQALTTQGTLEGFEAELQSRRGACRCEISGRRIEMGGDVCYLITAVDLSEQLRQKAQIKHLNATLEERVKKRTQELEETLARLRHTQAELIQSEKLAALGGMVAGIAHELNTPIGNGMMAATTLADETSRLVEQFQAQQLKRSTLEHYVEDAQTSSDILVRNLVKASDLISSFKQVAADQTSQQRRHFNLDALIEEIITTLRPQLKRTPYKVVTDLHTDLIMDSYPGPLGQALTNLISNAHTHGLEGRDQGVITVTTRQSAPDRVEIDVSDDGRGVPAEHRERLFDPFFTTRMGRGGSGLGLHIVHNLVTQVMGGQVELVNRPVPGATFRLQIPVTAPQHPGDSDTTAP
nr:PAS domain S-box protein [Motiliproteus sp. SC1-56]